MLDFSFEFDSKPINSNFNFEREREREREGKIFGSLKFFTILKYCKHSKMY